MPTLEEEMAAKALPTVEKSGNNVTIRGSGQGGETIHLVITNNATGVNVIDETGNLPPDGQGTYGPFTLADGNYTITITKVATGVSHEIALIIP